MGKSHDKKHEVAFCIDRRICMLNNKIANKPSNFPLPTRLYGEIASQKEKQQQQQQPVNINLTNRWLKIDSKVQSQASSKINDLTHFSNSVYVQKTSRMWSCKWNTAKNIQEIQARNTNERLDKLVKQITPQISRFPKRVSWPTDKYICNGPSLRLMTTNEIEKPTD